MTCFLKLLRAFDPLFLLIQQSAVIGKEDDDGVVIQPQALDRSQYLAVPVIDVGGLTRIVGAQAGNAFLGNLNVAVRRLGPAMRSLGLQIFVQKLGRRIPRFMWIKRLYMQIERSLVMILF